MLKELDRVVLTAPLMSEGLECGDVGTIVLAAATAKHLRSSSRLSTVKPPPSRRSRLPMCDQSDRGKSSTLDSSPHGEAQKRPGSFRHRALRVELRDPPSPLGYGGQAPGLRDLETCVLVHSTHPAAGAAARGGFGLRFRNVGDHRFGRQQQGRD